MPGQPTITLQGRDYPLRPFTIGQRRVIGPAYLQGVGTGSTENWDRTISVIDAALSRDHKSAGSVIDMEATNMEIAEAIEVIAAHAGIELKPVEGGPAGEAPAAPEIGET